jgi:DivIVA domain-containing protein
LDPDEIGRKSFETTFRGFDPTEVHAYLISVAGELRAVRDHAADVERRLIHAEQAAEDASVIDDDRLTAALGDEVATILESARSAAAALRAKAEIDAAALARSGEEQAVRVRREAEGILELRTAEAHQAAAEIEKEAQALRARAEVDAAAQVEAGKQQGREMVAEAQVVRERILKDLARRRRQARQQIEQLRAGRERLLDAYRVVRETSEAATGELEISLPAAKAAAETAGRSLDDDDDLSVQQLESMLDAARDAGLIEVPPADVDAVIDRDETAERDDTDAAGDDGHRDEDDAVAATAEPPAEDAADGARPSRSHRRSRRAERIVADEAAPPPVEGRRSSSVRVFRRDGEGGESEQSADDVESPAELSIVEDPPADDVEIVEVVEEVVEVVEVEGPVDGEDEVVIIEEVVEIVDAAGDGSADSATPGDAGGEVITGLFARIRADHAEPSASADTPAVSDRSEDHNGNGNGNGNGKASAKSASSGPRSRPAKPKGRAKPKAKGAAKPKGAAEPGRASAKATPEPEQQASDGDEVTAGDRRDVALAGPSRGLGRALKRVVADEQNEVLDVVRRQKKVPTIDDVLPETSEHALRYAAAARSELADAAYAGATFVDEGATDRPDVDDLAAELSLAVATPLRSGFDSAVAAAPDDRDALLDALRAVYRDAKGERVDDCVRHYAGEAFNRGVRAASTSGLDVRMLVDAGSKPAST